MKPILILRHAPTESPGVLVDALVQTGVPWVLGETWDGSRTEFNPRQWSGLVVLGGAMNTDQIDEYPFLPRVVQWLQQAVASQMPVLGICLGAQLLAQAAGSRVHHHTTKEIGWYDVHWTAEAPVDRLFEGIAPKQRVFQWHGDRFDLPRDASLLATGENCHEQAFRWGSLAWGLQFHPEVSAEIIEGWLTEEAGCSEMTELPYIDPAQIRAETPRSLPLMHQLGATLFGRFARLCIQRDV